MEKKTKIFIYPLPIMGVFLILTISCKKDDKDGALFKTTGVLKFKTFKPNATPQKSTMYLKSVGANPQLTGETSITILINMRACLGDKRVLLSKVKAGSPDIHEWIRLTSVKNRDLKLFEEYEFDPVELPVGTYKSTFAVRSGKKSPVTQFIGYIVVVALIILTKI